jgi:hypothetical protein
MREPDDTASRAAKATTGANSLKKMQIGTASRARYTNLH